MSKSKWWVLIILCIWVPKVKFDFDVSAMQCLLSTEFDARYFQWQVFRTLNIAQYVVIEPVVPQVSIFHDSCSYHKYRCASIMGTLLMQKSKTKRKEKNPAPVGFEPITSASYGMNAAAMLERTNMTWTNHKGPATKLACKWLLALIKTYF